MADTRTKILRSKIEKMQLDPFGFCNAKCWFCPVRYIPQPEEGSGNMPLDLMEKIFADLDAEKKKPNGVVIPNFNFFTTAHYNEVLLYKHVREMFELARKYKFTTYVLSNGISLHKHNVDLISEYKDVVKHVGLNIPAFEKELWAKRSGFSEDQFDRLCSNLEYASSKLSYLKHDLQIHVNGLNTSLFENNWVTKGPEFNDHKYDIYNEHEKQYSLAKSMFPGFSVNKALIFDRSGYIKNIVSNEDFAKQSMVGKRVVGCKNFGDRTSQWLHVNSAGKVFLCCNDYHFEYAFGDLTKQSIEEVWKSDEHIKVVEKAYAEICTGCISAVLETDNKTISSSRTSVAGKMRFSR